MRLKSLLWFLAIHSYVCWVKSSTVMPDTATELAKTLLPLLGLTEMPIIEGDVDVPAALKALYEAQIKFDLDTTAIPVPGLHTQSANTVRSFIHMESSIDGRFTNQHRFRLKFDVSSIPLEEQLKAAELKLTTENFDVATENSSTSLSQRIVVHDILKPGVKGVDGPITRVIDSQPVNNSRNSTTISLDVYPAVQRWMEYPQNNHGLLITIYSAEKKLKNVRLRRDTDEDERVWVVKQPILLTYTDDGKGQQRTGPELAAIRSKRAARRGGKRGGERDPCRRRQMYVNFRDVGWSDWIVAPLGYDAFYCDGECDYPMADHMNTTNHAIVQSLMNSVRPIDVPKPCCVPTQLTSMSMLYVDSQNKVILKNYKDMVVNSCGCR